MRALFLALLLAGCQKPVTKIDIFRGQDRVCVQVKQGPDTIAYDCVSAESLAVHLGDCE